MDVAEDKRQVLLAYFRGAYRKAARSTAKLEAGAGRRSIRQKRYALTAGQGGRFKTIQSPAGHLATVS